jgi:putative peptidoglycan lipid II flippase
MGGTARGSASEGAAVTRSAARVGAATLLSRFFGLARDTAFAVLFGTGFLADVFNLAFLIPNFFRRIVGEGNLNPAFVPVFTEVRERRGEAAAGSFLRRAGGALAAVVLPLTLSGMALAAPLVSLYAKDWRADPEGFDFAVFLLRVLFPTLPFAAFAALSAAALNARRRFTVPALSPILLNVCFLLGAAAAPLFGSAQARLLAFSVGGLAGGLAAWLVQVPAMRRAGLPNGIEWAPRDPDVVRTGRLMIPGILALGVTQLNLFVDTLLALRLPEGSLTALRLGNRVMLLPLGVVAVAVATASLPALSRRAAARDTAALVETLAHTLRLLMTLLVPAAVGLVILARPIIELLFQYGQFTAERSTPMTAAAVAFYALGLPAYGISRGLAQAFYSVQDTGTPVKVGVASMLANVALNFALLGPLGLRGLALATSLAGWLNVVLLLRPLRRQVGPLPWPALGRAAARVAVASAALAAACLLGVSWAGALPGSGLPIRCVRVGLEIALGIAALLAAYRALGHAEMKEILASLPGRRSG